MIWMTMMMLAAPQAAAADPETIMTITVQKLPSNYTAPPIVHLEFTTKGEVATCAVTRGSGNASIDRVVCDQVKLTVKEKAGKKAPAARDATVAFVAEAPKPAPKG